MKIFKIEIEYVNFESLEIQSTSLDEIAEEKARDAFRKLGRPL